MVAICYHVTNWVPPAGGCTVFAAKLASYMSQMSLSSDVSDSELQLSSSSLPAAARKLST